MARWDHGPSKTDQALILVEKRPEYFGDDVLLALRYLHARDGWRLR